MKINKLFSKLFITYFSISVIGLAILLLITRFALKNFYYNETATNLIQKANLIEEDLSELVIQKKYLQLQSKVDELSKVSQNRITIILPTGEVVADSSTDPVKMENHSEREEIKNAIAKGLGESVRFSPTLKENLMYVAIPLRQNSKIIAVVRNAISTDKLQASLTYLLEKVFLWSLLLLMILTYFIYVQAKKISSPLEVLRQNVEVFEIGNFKERIKMPSSQIEEISALSKAIEKMGVKLQTQFVQINKQKNEQLAIFGSMLEGVITVDLKLKIYHINKAALHLFNHTSEKSLKGLPLKTFVKSDRIYEMCKEILKTRKTAVNEFEYESGTVLNIHGSILESKEKGIMGVVLVFNDITKMRELENHRKQFVGNVSHELKTPLTSIQGYLETLRDEDIEDTKIVRKFIDIIYKQSMRLKTIIEDLLILSSIEKESEIGDIKLERSSIFPVLENVISLCQENADKKGIKIKLEGEDTIGIVNTPLLEQAIINLLDNAIKYSPENSEVIIKLEKLNSLINIIVEDKGQGIDPIHHERLFERFYSADKARSRELGGSGLGLSIVKHIALSHAGNIKVESQLNQGSKFIFELPSSPEVPADLV